MWRHQQTEFSSWVVYHHQHPNARSFRGNHAAWPAYDGADWGGRLLTGAMLRLCVGQLAATGMHRITLRLQSLDGQMICSDDAFKFGKRVKGPALMVHTVGNENHEIIAFATELTKSVTEMSREIYTGLYNRYRQNNFVMPSRHDVDNPRVMQQLLGGDPALFPSLSDGSKYSSKFYVRFDGTIMVCESQKDVLLMASLLRSNILEVGVKCGKPNAVGVDIEWEYISEEMLTGDGDSTQRPTAIGFASDRFCVIVRTSKFTSLPDEFAAILTDPSIMKVGAATKADATKIQQHFGVVVAPTVDVLLVAKQKCAKTKTGAWGLADVCDTIFERKILKDPLMRCSFIGDPKASLTGDQQIYLAVDCSAPLMLYRRFQDIPDLPDHGTTTLDTSSTRATKAPRPITAASVGVIAQEHQCCFCDFSGSDVDVTAHQIDCESRMMGDGPATNLRSAHTAADAPAPMPTTIESAQQQGHGIVEDCDESDLEPADTSASSAGARPGPCCNIVYNIRCIGATSVAYNYIRLMHNCIQQYIHYRMHPVILHTKQTRGWGGVMRY